MIPQATNHRQWARMVSGEESIISNSFFKKCLKERAETWIIPSLPFISIYRLDDHNQEARSYTRFVTTCRSLTSTGTNGA